MIKVSSNKRVSARDVYIYSGVKTRFNDWINKCIENADLKKDKDFYLNYSKSTGGRRAMEIELTIDAAKEICLMSATSKSKELRRWLISLGNQRESLELLNVKEFVFALKLVNCLKYIENQKEALFFHKETFVKENNDTIDPKFIYAEFNKYRSKIIGWDKAKVDSVVTDYLNNHSGYNKSNVMNSDMSTKLSVIDIGEAIRVAVLDILFAKHESDDMAVNFSNLCKNLAKEMEVKPEKENERNLFKGKEVIENIKSISLK